MEEKVLLYDMITKEYIYNLIYGDLARAKLFKDKLYFNCDVR